MLRLRVSAAAAAIGLIAVALTSARPADTAAPPNFTDTLVASVASPTALAFTPDGRLLIATQTGALRVLSGGALLPASAIDLTVCNGEEQGLLGVTADPAFATNGFVYLYYTHDHSGSCENRVSRFTMSGDTLDPASELVLVDGIPSPAGIHNAGDLHFGNDGYLYISVGDGGCDYLGDSGCGGANNASRDQNVLLGKILRVTSTGGIPASNPFQGSDSARCNSTGRTTPGKKCQETFAWGLRNPFRIAFDPNTTATRFFINDVGQNDLEEIDEGTAGADYGWNVREGDCCGARPAGMTDPIYEYPHTGGCAAITGGAFVPNGVWPSAYDNTYIYADYVCGQLFVLTKGANGYTSTAFATGDGSPVEVIFGPYGSTQALYYTNYSNGGEIRRIAYTGAANRAPTAALTATPSSGAAPLTVSLDGTKSSDPDSGDTLTYRWSFGDGTADTQTSTPTTQHVYSTSGTYNASLTVVDNHGLASQPVTTRIDAGNSPPVPSIDAPSAAFRFKVGESIHLAGSATDPEDGTLDGSHLSWTVIKHHNTHTHPFLAPTVGSSVDIVAPEPEDAAAADTSYLEVQLTATDSNGRTATTTMNVLPKKLNVTLATSPAGLRLELFGQPAPSTLVGWENWQLTLNAPDQVDANGQGWVFSGWSDGGARGHNVVLPGADVTYTATFVPAPAPPAPSGLVAAYGFDENAGTRVADASGKANTGTATGTTWTTGRFGSALSFNGSSSRVTVPDAPSLDLTKALTLEAWVKPTVTTNWRTVAVKERAGGILYSLYGSQATNTPVGQVDIGGEQNAAGASPLPLNTWSHLATTWDGSTLRLYVNGTQVSAKTVNGTLATSTQPLSIGGNGVWGEYFSGAIDELRLYDHALTAAEIQGDMSRAVGTGAPSDTTPPTAPAQLTATVAGSDVSLGWSAASDAGGVARYHVHRSTTTGFAPSAANEIGTSTSTSYTDAGRPAGTYYYVVRAEDSAGNVGAPSPQAQATVAPPPPPPPPPAGGLVAAYSFDENGGTTAGDSSGNGNKGTLEGAGWAAGKNGAALSLNGSSSRVTIPDSPTLDLTKALTLEAWVRPTSSSGWGTVVFKERTGGMLYSLYSSNAGNKPVGQVFQGSERNAQGASAVPLNTWTHLATTWDGATLRLYVNGTQAASTGVTGAIGTSTGPLRIGGNGIWKEFFKGQIDDVRVYDHALTATEIKSDMQRPVTAAAPAQTRRAGPGLVAAYNFDEQSGDVVVDSSGLGNDGVANGGPSRVAGHTGGAISFDGSGEMVTVPSSASVSPSEALTVEAWVDPSQLGDTWRTIALKERAGGMCWALYAHDGSGAAAHVYTTSELRTRGAALPTGSWTHLAMTYDGTVLALYRDGVLAASSFVSGPIATSSGALRIGGNTIWQEPFVGAIDDVRIYDRALDAGEIADDMQHPV